MVPLFMDEAFFLLYVRMLVRVLQGHEKVCHMKQMILILKKMWECSLN